MLLSERAAAVPIGMAVLVPASFKVAHESGLGHGPMFRALGDVLFVAMFFGAFLFPPFVAAVAGRRAVLWGVLATMLPVLVSTYLAWNPEQYPGGRWNYFWSREAGTLGFLVGFLHVAAGACGIETASGRKTAKPAVVGLGCPTIDCTGRECSRFAFLGSSIFVPVSILAPVNFVVMWIRTV